MKNIDKLYHFMAGVIIAIIVTLLTDIPLWGFMTGVVAGGLKEVYDELDYSGGDFFDFFATALGAFVGVVAIGLLNNITI